MKIAIPDLISNSYFPAVAAVELGFFKEEGVDMELELIFPVDKTLEVLRDGGIDLSFEALDAFGQILGKGFQPVRLASDVATQDGEPGRTQLQVG